MDTDTINMLIETMNGLRTKGYTSSLHVARNGDISITLYKEIYQDSEDFEVWDPLSHAQKMEMSLSDILYHALGHYDDPPDPPGDDMDEVEQPVWWKKMSDQEKRSWLDWNLDSYYATDVYA